LLSSFSATENEHLLFGFRIKNEFMTLIFVRVIFEQALQDRMDALHCRNYNYVIVKNKSRNIIDLYED
jgi:hypothetical protein